MGAIAEAFAAYAKPLLDGTDGSPEDFNKAIAVSQFCYNLALTAEEMRDEMLEHAGSTFGMDDEEFEAFRRDHVIPMIERHEQMFPFLHRKGSIADWFSDVSPADYPEPAARQEKLPKADRYAPCPCNSGKKYRFCCGAKGR